MKRALAILLLTSTACSGQPNFEIYGIRVYSHAGPDRAALKDGLDAWADAWAEWGGLSRRKAHEAYETLTSISISPLELREDGEPWGLYQPGRACIWTYWSDDECRLGWLVLFHELAHHFGGHHRGDYDGDHDDSAMWGLVRDATNAYAAQHCAGGKS